MTWETALRMTAAIARPRIMARLDVAAERPVILVEAPAGYGKSVAVRQWVATRRDGPAVWIDLPTVATRPARFVSALLREAGTAIEGSSTRAPGRDDAVPEEALDDGLAALSRTAGAVTVVLDRVDGADAAIMALIRRFVDGLPPSWRLVLTSRTTPAVGVARLRAALAIATVDATDLRFDTTETAALLRGSLGLGVDDATVADLTLRLGGWPAGIMLVGVSAQRRADPVEALRTVTGRHPWIDDYLSAEVLPALAADLRAFLVRTAPLPRLSPELCNAVTGGRDAAVQLESLRSWAAVSVEYTATGAWSTLEPAFRDWLGAVALRTSADGVRRSHAAAARWFCDHGMLADAVDAGVAAGDPRLVAELLAEHGYTLVRREPWAVMRAVSAMPAATVDAQHPELWLLAADAAAAVGDGARASQLTDLARNAADGLTGERANAVRRGVAMLDLAWYLRDGHVTEAGRLVSILVPPVADRPRDTTMHAGWDADRARLLGDLTSYLMGAQHAGRSTAVRAVVACHQGDPAVARALASRLLGGEGDVDGTALALAALALAWSGADADVHHAAGVVAEPTTDDWWLTACLRHLVAVEAARREHRWRTARQHLDQAQEVLDEVPDPGPVPALLLVHAIGRLEGEVSSAALSLTERESLVLQHLAHSQSRREIAQRLHLSPNTVKSHLRSAYRKLGAASRRDALDRAQRMGVLDGAPSSASASSTMITSPSSDSSNGER